MVAAISGLFTSTFEEGVKKLIQPAALIPAALLVLLHLVVTYPVLLEAGQPTIVTLDGLAELWKIALALAAILGIGYVIQAATPWIGEVFSGDALPSDSWVAQRLQRRQERALERLSERIRGGHGDEEHMDLELERVRRFPWNEAKEEPVEHLNPTALGNAFLAAAWSVWNAHGIDPTVVWMHMRMTLRKDHADVLQAVDDEKTAIDTLLNLAFVLVVFAATAPLATASVGEFGTVPVASASLVAAYGVYRVALRRVRSWSEALQAAFDLKRDELGMALGLAAEGESLGPAAWQHASRDIAWSQGQDVLRAQLRECVTIQPSPSLAVTRLPTVTLDSMSGESGTGEGSRTYRWEHLVGLRSIAAKDAAPAFQYLLVCDARLPRLAALPEIEVVPSDVEVHGVIRPGDADNPDAIVWMIRELSANGELLLRYALERRVQATVTSSPVPLTVRVSRATDDHPERYRVCLRVDREGASPVADGAASPLVVRVADEGVRLVRRCANWVVEGREPVRVEARPIDPRGTWEFIVPSKWGFEGDLGVFEEPSDD